MVIAKSRKVADEPATEKRKERLARDLLDKASILFATKGYAGTTLGDIANALGLTRAAIYYYYKNKEAVLLAIVSEVSTAPIEAIETWRKTASPHPRERLRSLVQLHTRSVLSLRNQIRMLEGAEAILPTDLTRTYDATKRRIHAEYIEMIKAGAASGDFRDFNPDLAAYSLAGMVNWTIYWANTGEEYVSAIAQQLSDLAVQAMSSDRTEQQRFANRETALETLREDMEQLSQLL